MNYLTPHIDTYDEEAALISESAQDLFGQLHESPLSKDKGYREEVWTEMGAMGWLGWAIPEEHGGIGLRFASGLALHESLGAAAAPEPLVEIALLSAALLAYRPETAQHQQWLNSLITGDYLGCFVWQPRMAADPLQKAQLDFCKNAEGQYILNGQLGFAALPESDFFLVQAGPKETPSLFLVPRQAKGLNIVKTPRADQRYWADLHFDNVKLEPEQLVLTGKEAKTAIEEAKAKACLALSAQMLGAASEVFHKTLDYIKLRKQFDQKISSFQAIQHQAANLAIQLEVLRACVQESARVFDAPNQSIENKKYAASRAKARASQSALHIIKECIQLHGGIAYTEECDLGNYLKQVMVQSAWLGNATYHRNKIAQSQLDLDSYIGLEKPEWFAEIQNWVRENLPEKYKFPAKRQSWRAAHEWHQMLYEKNIVAPAWPKAFGGMGLNPYEELMLYDIYESFGINIFQNMGITMLGPLLQKYGTKKQQEKYLPGILSGETYWCQGYSEPEAGSDLAALRTSAVLDGDHFIVNGQKIWTSLAHEADMMFLLVRTDPHVKKQAGISFLLVDMQSPGITVEPIVNLTGTEDFCTVFFDNVKVPKENLVGEINKGWGMAKSLLGSERIMIGHPRFAKAAFSYLKEYVDTHQISDFNNELNDLAADILDLEALYVRYLNALRQGKELTVETSVLKIYSSETWQKTMALFLEIAGIDSTINESVNLNENLKVHLPFQFLHAIPASIYGGTNEIQRNIIAGRMLQM